MSRLSELTKDTALFAISNFASKVLVFLMVPLYTSVLTTEDYGISDLITSTVSLLLPIFTMCISEAVLRYTIENKDKGNHSVSIGINICVLSALIVAVITPVISMLLNVGNCIWFIPVYYLFTAMTGVLSKFARAIDKVKESAIAGVIQTFVIVLLNVLFLVYFKWGVVGYLTAYVLGSLSSTIYLFLSCDVTRKYSLKLFKSETSSYISYSMPLVPNSISWWLMDSASRYIIRFIISLSAIGIYAAAIKVPTILNVLSSIFMEAWLLSVLKEYDKPGSKEFIAKGYSLFNFAMMICSFGLITLSYPIARILIRGEFLEGWVYMPIMICSTFYGSLSGFIGCIYSAEKCTSLYFKTTIFGGVVSLVIGFFLAPSFGLYGVVTGVLIGYIANWLCRLYTTRKYLNLKLSLVKEIINHCCLVVAAFCISFNATYIAIGLFVLFILVNISVIKDLLYRMKPVIINRLNRK